MHDLIDRSEGYPALKLPEYVKSKVNCYHPFAALSDDAFVLNQAVFYVRENPSDGYRSHLEGLVWCKDDTLQKNYLGFTVNLTTVNYVSPCRIEEAPEHFNLGDRTYDFFEGYVLIDASGVVHFVFGTDNVDDYYPCYVSHPIIPGGRIT